MNFPISAATLAEALPHRPPMVWIDEVLEASATAGKAAVQVKADAAYRDSRGNRPSAAIEWMAQAFGFVQAAHRAQTANTMPVKRAFLASVSDFRSEADLTFATGILTVTVDGFREFGPLVLFRGVVHDAKGHKLAEGRLKVFVER